LDVAALEVVCSRGAAEEVAVECHKDVQIHLLKMADVEDNQGSNLISKFVMLDQMPCLLLLCHNKDNLLQVVVHLLQLQMRLLQLPLWPLLLQRCKRI
jgi:hypothetical protein